MSNPPIVVLEDVHRSFPAPGPRGPEHGWPADDDIQVLKGVDLQVAAGETLAVVGPSGSGKSTLLSLMGALDAPTSGRVLVDGRDVATLSEGQRAALRSRRIGFIFQLHHLLPQCTAWENVLVPTLALRRQARSTGAPPRQPASGVAEGPEARAGRLLERVGLGARLGHRPAELSGGECLRVAVARALINGPAVLLADEPTGSLDADSAAALVELLVELNREEGVSLVVVTHSVAVARCMGRIHTLDRGQLSANGAAER